MLKTLSDHLTDLKILLTITRHERANIIRLAIIERIATASEHCLKLSLNVSLKTPSEFCSQIHVRCDPCRDVLSSAPESPRHRRSELDNNRTNASNNQRAQSASPELIAQSAVQRNIERAKLLSHSAYDGEDLTPLYEISIV